MTSSTEVAVRGEILPQIPPRLREAGVAIIERDGYRTLSFPPELRSKYNVINPVVELSQVNPDFQPMIREIKLNQDGDSYSGASHHKSDEASLNKQGLFKLAEAAKIELRTRRIAAHDLGSTERLGWTAVASQRHSDGTVTNFESSSTFDNEAERLKIEAQVAKSSKSTADKAKSVESQWLTKIQKASELTETLAIERAIRGILKLPHTLKKNDFTKPWAVVCYGFIPTTPEARVEAARAISRLYGVEPGPQSALPPPSRDGHQALASGSHSEEDDPGAGDGNPTPLDVGAGSSENEYEVVEGEVIDENGDEPYVEAEPVEEAVTTSVDEALLERARAVKPPVGSLQEKTLVQVLAMPREAGVKWLRWALGKPWPRDEFGDFEALLRAFVAADAPHLLEEGS